MQMSAASAGAPREQPRGNMTSAERVTEFLNANKGNGFCDACIRLATGVEPYNQVDQIVRSLSLSKDYLRRVSDCKRCGRTREVTALVSRSYAAKSE